ncbi:MAG: ABC transporter substrate-binding protein [Pseudomonadota bacterium]|nr:ABC transporter substrate-binding protein [Pseudomonadota bacterium]
MSAPLPAVFNISPLVLSLCAAAFALAAPSAQAVDAGVTDSEIRIGASAVLSGPLGPQTLAYGAGAKLYFDSVNAAGGVNGRKIVYTQVDDGFDVPKSLENSKKLIQDDKVFVLFQPTGTPHTTALLPLATESKTIVFGPFTGASSLRETPNRYLFHVRAGYGDEAQRIVQQLRQLGSPKVAMFYQDDGFGKTLLAEVKRAAEALKLPLIAEVKVDPKNPDFKAAAEQLNKAAPQTIIMGTAGGTFSNLVKAVYATPLRPTVYGFSVANVDTLSKDLGPQASGIVLAQIMPSIRNTTTAIVSEYLGLARSKDAQARPSSAQFEGFVHAKLRVQSFKAAGPKLSTDSFIKGMEGLGEVRYDKFTARYTPQSHNGANYVELAIVGKAGELRY